MDKTIKIAISPLAFYSSALFAVCPAQICEDMYINPTMDYSSLKKEKEFQEATCIGDIEVQMLDKDSSRLLNRYSRNRI